MQPTCVIANDQQIYLSDTPPSPTKLQKTKKYPKNRQEIGGAAAPPKNSHCENKESLQAELIFQALHQEKAITSH